ncbi:MAG: PP2C family protein-serine/threonine phosphatase [Methylacidiphilaceae bacterium]|nr:PP2C family protein-serine/threonine phosphatase [Candidatus Methylacidiphilaceae bacterium]
METNQANQFGDSSESLLLIAELGRALGTDGEPESLVYILLERLAAFLKASGIALLSGGERGEVGAIWGRGELSVELGAMAQRLWKSGREGRGSKQVEMEGPWTLLSLSGSGFPFGLLAICLESGGDLCPAERSAAQAVGEAALRLAKRSACRSGDRKARHLEAELLAARLFQESLFPRMAPALPGFRLAAAHSAAGELSGDFYDLLPLDSHTCGILIGDVAGKGIAAALIGGMCRVAVRCQAAGSRSPAGVLRRVNRLLHEDLAERTLVAMIYAVIDTQTHEIRLARAGQEEPLLRRDSGVVQVDAPGLCLGIDSGETFDSVLEDVSLFLEPGELLLFYTDGMTDAVGPSGTSLDRERLAAMLGKTTPRGAQASLEDLFQELRLLCSSGELVDDVTLVALERVGR